MKKREYMDYLNDILECINDVKSFKKYLPKLGKQLVNITRQ